MEDYNKQIEQLKEEMNDATHGADNIRNDISALAQRYAVIDRDEECGVLIFLALATDKISLSVCVATLNSQSHTIKIFLLYFLPCTLEFYY